MTEAERKRMVVLEAVVDAARLYRQRRRDDTPPHLITQARSKMYDAIDALPANPQPMEETAAGRKVVHLTAIQATEQTYAGLVALCDDGTMWTGALGGKWEPVAPIPLSTTPTTVTEGTP